MTPFADFLFEIRRSRGLRQRELAEVLAVDPSYISALEAGRRDPPDQGRLRHFSKLLQLSTEQMQAFCLAAEQSSRRIEIPSDTTKEEYILAHEFAAELGSFSRDQIEMMRVFLRIKRTEIQLSSKS